VAQNQHGRNQTMQLSEHKMNTFTIRLYYNAESAAMECGPDQVVAELYDGWFVNVPPNASIATGYPITRILGVPVRKPAPKKATPQRTLRRGICGALKPRKAPVTPKAERAKLIERFTFYDPKAPTAPDYLVEELITKDCEIVFIGGQSGSGKTLVAVDLAVCLATARPFFGKAIGNRYGTAILAAESPGSLRNRLHVAAERAAPGEPLPICYLGNVPDLKNQKEVAALIQTINAVSDEFEEEHGVPLGVVIIDTLSAAFDLKDENDNSEAAAMIKVMKDIGRETGTIVMPVHHYGKAITTGLRGASAYKGGTDIVISVLADINEITGSVLGRRLALAKSRDDEQGEIAPFDLRYVEIGKSDSGKPYGSCCVEPMLGQAPEKEKTRKGKKESQSLTVFRKSFAEIELTPINARDNGPRVMAAKVIDVRAEFNRRWTTGGETDKKKRDDAVRNAFNRALKDAKENGFATDFQNDIEWIWKVTSVMDDDVINTMVARKTGADVRTRRYATDFSGVSGES
jgi:hypothetical protein